MQFMNKHLLNNDQEKVLVMGIGNYLLGDEGVGVHFVNTYHNDLEELGFDVLDGGTGGFHLLGILENYTKVILIDATMDGEQEGMVKRLRPRFSNEFPSALSAHDIGLKDLVEGLIIRDKLPEVVLITVSINAIQNMQVELSPLIQRSLKEVYNEILQLFPEFS